MVQIDEIDIPKVASLLPLINKWFYGESILEEIR